MSRKSVSEWTRMVVCTAVLMFFAFTANAFGQVRCSLNVKDVSLKEAFQKISEMTNYQFVYSNNEIEAAGTVTVDMRDRELSEIVAACLRGTGLGFRIENQVVIISPKIVNDGEDEKTDGVTVKGWVRDENQKPLPGVTILLTGTSVGTATNSNGWFLLPLPMTSGRLVFSFVGYEKKYVHFTESMANDTLNIILEASEEELDEVVVTGYQTMRKSDVVGSVMFLVPDVSSMATESEIKLVNFDIKFNMLFDIVIMLSGYVVWIVGGWLIIQPESTVTYGMIITFVGYVNMLAGPMDFISYIFRWGSNSLNSGQRIFEILDARPEITEKKDCVHLETVNGRVEMKNVVFEYETGKPVLKGVSFSVNAGQPPAQVAEDIAAAVADSIQAQA